MTLWTLLVAMIAVPAVAAGATAADPAQTLLDSMAAEIQRSTPGSRGPAECTVSGPQISPHHAHGPNPLDYRRELVLRNARITYVLPYWMNVTDANGKNPVAIEGSSGLGMSAPNRANWYINNFFEFRLGGREILKRRLAHFEVVTPRGERATARMRWNCPEGNVTLDISLGSNDDHLTFRCTVDGLRQEAPVDLGFRAYPGHYQPPRNRRAATRRRELSPARSYPLAPDETGVVLWDEADPRTPCAIEFAEAGAESARLDLQTYGVTLWLHFPPSATLRTGPIRIWDAADASLNDLMQEVFGRRQGPGKAD